MTQVDVHGPIDFVLLEFTGDKLTGRAAEEVLRLADNGTIRLFDVMFVGKSPDGEVYAVDLAAEALAEALGVDRLAGARSGLLADDDIKAAAEAMMPGTLAVMIVYENAWAIPFIAAARESGGEMVATARIPADEVMAALDALERSSEPLQPTS
jgi:uncharacterized protein DUF6325